MSFDLIGTLLSKRHILTPVSVIVLSAPALLYV